jgi:lysophospholipid hydrolase
MCVLIDVLAHRMTELEEMELETDVTEDENISETMFAYAESTESLAVGISDESADVSTSYAVTNISVAIGILTVILTVLYFWLRRRETRAVPSVEVSNPKLRFRKREKIMFYGRKMLRRVRSFAKGGITPSSGSGRRSGGRESRKRKLVLSIARRLLRFRRDQEPQFRQVPRELPPSLLEVDWPPGLEPSPEYRLPAELMYMLRNVRVLGHFEKPIFLELCRFMESRFLPAGAYLFRVGDPDDSIYVVQSGCVEVRIAEPQDGVDYCVKVFAYVLLTLLRVSLH